MQQGDDTSLDVLGLILLHVKNNLCSTTPRLSAVGLDGERTSGRGLPDVLLVIVVLGVDGDLVRHQVGGVETNAELPDHGDVGASGQSLHEGLGAGLGDGAEVVDHVGLGHADTGVDDCERLGVAVRDNLDEQLILSLKLAGVSERLIPDLIQSIGGIGDQLPEENFFVGVECVDDQTHKLSNLSLESEGFNIVSHLGVCNYSGMGTGEQNLAVCKNFR